MPERNDVKFVWVIGAIFGPALLVVIELFHPAGFTIDPGMFQYLTEPHQHTSAHHALDYFGPDWWFWLHMIQTPTVVLFSIALVLSVGAIAKGAALPAQIAAWVTRAALYVFAVYYTVLDGIGGIGLGRSLEITKAMAHDTSYTYAGKTVDCVDAAGAPTVCLNPDQLEGVTRVLNATWTDQWVGGVGSMVSLTGSYAVLIAAVALAVTLVLARGISGMSIIAWVSIVPLVSGGWYVQESHACCTGPTGFGLFCLFSCLTWWDNMQREPKN
ncbi:MAG: hypothetical protein ACPGGK_16335 [Pikeienuella sp.]